MESNHADNFGEHQIDPYSLDLSIVQVLSCLLAAASSLYLYHPAPLLVHPSSGYGLNQAHPGGGSSFQHVSRLHKREAEADPLLIHHGLPLAYHTGYPNWPGVRALGFSSTCYGCRGKRSAEPYRVPLLAAYHHPVPLPFVHHLVPTATGEVTESGAGYEVKQNLAYTSLDN